jgi:hypothetical protein
MINNYRTKAIKAFTNYKNIMNYRKFRKFRTNPRYLKIKSHFFPVAYQCIDINSIHVLSDCKAINVFQKYKMLLEELTYDPIVPINLFG